MTLGEFGDLSEASRYRQYLERRKQACTALWLLSTWVKRVPSVEDLVGVWDDGEILTKREHYMKAKQKILDQHKNHKD